MHGEMRLQYQLSNGRWVDCQDDRTQMFLAYCEEFNGINETGEIVPRALAIRPLTRDEVIQALGAGRILRNDDADWYSNCRCGAADEAKRAKRRAAQPPPSLVQCTCGHTVPKSLVMSASLGSACAVCYDRMSD